jgi:hypothetical protein
MLTKGANGSIIGMRHVNESKMYLGRDAIKHYIIKQHGSYLHLRRELENMGALVRYDQKKNLTQGIVGMQSAPQYVWEIDLSCPALENIIKDVEPVEKGKVLPFRKVA